MTSHARELLLGSAHVERAKILVPAGVRTAIVATVIILALTLSGHSSYSLPTAIGAVFVAMAEAGETVGRRWRTMLWCTMWLMLATGLGGLSGDFVVLGLVLVMLWAFFSGAVGMLGPRAAIAGLLSLVLFVVFAGGPASDRTVIGEVLSVGFGGLIITAVTVLPALMHSEARRIALEPLPPLRDRIRGKTNLEDEFLRHGIRLAILIGIASIISAITTWPHDYWLPMTVAWVTKPDATGTASKILARVAGTVVGVLVVALLVDGLHINLTAMAIAAGIASGVTVAFIWANYVIAVAGITTLVVGLFAFDGEPVIETIVVRVALTIAAGAMAFCGFYIWPPVSRRKKRAGSETLEPGTA